MSGQNFFDVRQRLVPARPARAVAVVDDKAAPLSIGAITRMIDGALRGGLPPAVRVVGEVSNFSHHRASGHAYFTLKDADACLACVMFKGSFERVQFRPTDGLSVVAGGSVKVYAATGKYQLYVDSLLPVGQGALELAVRKLREKLVAEGLFDRPRKPLPRFPLRIGIITSRETSVLHDMTRTLGPFPWLKILHYHAPVQGEQCARSVAAAIGELNRRSARLGGVDVIVVARGGGSYEDLAGFNDEAVARAIVASTIPVITGIGHDTDVSVADQVADHHAHTPTQAVAVAAAGWVDIRAALDDNARRLFRAMRTTMSDGNNRVREIERDEFFRYPARRIDHLRERLDHQGAALMAGLSRAIQRRQQALSRSSDRLQRQTPAAQLTRARQRVDGLDRSLAEANRRAIHKLTAGLDAAERRLATVDPKVRLGLFQSRWVELSRRLTKAGDDGQRRRAERVDSLAAKLELLSPDRVLERGYTVTLSKKTGRVVRSAAGIAEPDRIVTRFHDGEVESVVEDPNKPKLFS